MYVETQFAKGDRVQVAPPHRKPNFGKVAKTPTQDSIVLVRIDDIKEPMTYSRQYVSKV